MARIKIKDLPKDKKISKEEMNKIVGGYLKYELKNIAGNDNEWRVKNLIGQRT